MSPISNLLRVTRNLLRHGQLLCLRNHHLSLPQKLRAIRRFADDVVLDWGEFCVDVGRVLFEVSQLAAG